MPKHGVVLGGVGLAFALALTGCGGSDSDVALKRAEARVSDAEQAVADAQSSLDTASKAFCTAAASYITALDRYGDVLHATAPTVGDVRTAGRDLEDPQDVAMSEAEAAVTANQELAAAQAELVTAQQQLASLQAGATSTATQDATTPSPTPLAPASSVSRVTAAEAAFETAADGISEQTPLDEAAEEFNAAAVALELSWLALVADAGCLSDDQAQRAEASVRAFTTALQTSLASTGYYDGEVDGIYGPETVAAIKSLQQAHQLPVTGTLDKASQDALAADLLAQGGAAAQEATANTAALQQTLTLLGYWDGPVDGTWTPELTEALTKAQKALGVDPTGTVDAATVSALESALAAASEALTSTPTPAPTVTVTVTPSPSASSSGN